ncbi:MAG TPA: hypothetical protein VGC64_01665, partial [Pyrinomonadaceae bacterium]
MDEKPLIRRRWVAALLILLCWTFLALLFTPQTYLVNQQYPSPLSWGEALAANLTVFYLWAALTPLVLWLGKRFPIERRFLPRNLSIHFILGLVLTIVHVVLLRYANYLLLDWTDEQQGPMPFKSLLLGIGATDILLFWGLLIASQAL